MPFAYPIQQAYQIATNWKFLTAGGSIVYQSQNPQDCWQPENNLASGVYFYVLTLGKQEYTGQVTVFN
jgi:hypothetical protein